MSLMMKWNMLHGGEGGRVSNLPLSQILAQLGLTTGLQLVLDAGDVNSYPGSGQSWLDRSGNGFDFFLGANNSATASDPTFNGVAGALSANENFSHDGGDWFTYDSANETWMQIHKDNAVFTIAIWFMPNGTSSGANFWGTTAGGLVGAHCALTTNNAILYVARNDSVAAKTVVSTAGFTSGAWGFAAIALDESVGAGGGTFQINATQEAINSAYASPSSNDAAQVMQIGALGAGAGATANGSRFAQFMAWNRRLSTTELTQLHNATRGRFGV